MKSFISRQARQSPSKLRDAEKAFLQSKHKRKFKQMRKPREVSPLGIRVAQAQAQTNDTMRSFDEQAYRTLSYISRLRPDSIHARGQNASPQTQTQWQRQPKMHNLEPAPQEPTLQDFTRVSLTLASKFFSKQTFGQKSQRT